MTTNELQKDIVLMEYDILELVKCKPVAVGYYAMIAILCKTTITNNLNKEEFIKQMNAAYDHYKKIKET